jgi:hypothetical protein
MKETANYYYIFTSSIVRSRMLQWAGHVVWVKEIRASQKQATCDTKVKTEAYY